MKLSELQIISYLHHVYVWILALSEFGLGHLVSIYISLLIYYYISYLNHLHTSIIRLRLSRPQTQVYKPPFPVFFSEFVDFPPLMNNTCSYMIKDPCVFSVWLIWAFINNAKHMHLEFLLLIPMEKNNFLPSSCISRVIRITCLQTTYLSIVVHYKTVT